APAQGDEVVLRGVDADAVEPRVERAVAAEIGERPVGLDERFLRDVLDLGGVADHAREQALQLALVLGDEQLESMLVSALRLLDQLLVDFAVAHASLEWKLGCGGEATQSPLCGRGHEGLVGLLGYYKAQGFHSFGAHFWLVLE